MALVSYSDSEGSDSEKDQPPAKATESVASRSAPGSSFKVDKSNPRRIRVNLQESRAEPSATRDGDGEPASKKARVGGTGFSGFNSMLPAPKRGNQSANGGSTKSTTRKVFSLKTGAEPGFNREADAELRQLFAEQDEGSRHESVATSDGNEHVLSTPSGKLPIASVANTDPPKQGNPMMFKPLSVARNPQKKKKPTASTKPPASTIATANEIKALAKPTSKVSLFSLGSEQQENPAPGSPKYEPLIYGSTAGDGVQSHIEDTAVPPQDSTTSSTRTTDLQSGPQSLDSIASDLNLSASARRQLFGRNAKSATVANIVSFNTDEEYRANEVLRASGEQVQHNPVRAIAPGKHSLKQLVNAASGQKDALEESFAAGKRNKQEAGSKYGW